MSTEQTTELLKKVDDNRETLNDFESKIAYAQSNGDEWVETSPEIIFFFNRKGLGPSNFFIYKGIKVCVQGKQEEIEKLHNRPLNIDVYGPNAGVILGNPS